MSGHLKPKVSDSLLQTKEIPSAESERYRSSTNAASKTVGEVNEDVAEADKNEASRSGMEDTETLHMAVTEIESGNQSDADHKDADQNDDMDDRAGSPLVSRAPAINKKKRHLVHSSINRKRRTAKDLSPSPLNGIWTPDAIATDVKPDITTMPHHSEGNHQNDDNEDEDDGDSENVDEQKDAERKEMESGKQKDKAMERYQERRHCRFCPSSSILYTLTEYRQHKREKHQDLMTLDGRKKLPVNQLIGNRGSNGKENGQHAAKKLKNAIKQAAAQALGQQRDDANDDDFWRSTEEGYKMQLAIDRNNGLRGERRKCGLCPAEISPLYTAKSYRKHRAGKHDRVHICPLCDAGFPSPSDYQRHQRQKRCRRS